MKNERGVTLISLTVYLIAFTIIISLMATLSSYFYKNVSSALDKIDPIIEYSRFIAFFTDDVNQQGIKVLECGNLDDDDDEDDEDEGYYIVFSNGVQYTFLKDNKGIYKNKAKICRKVENCQIQFDNTKGKISLEITIGGKSRSNSFTLN